MRTAVFLLVCGCTASASEVEPPEDQIFFPTGIAIAPNDAVLFVASANSELRYDSGSISVVDLASVDQTIATWTSGGTDYPSACTPDPDHRETLQCPADEFIMPGAGARVGNFATDIAVQDTGGGNLRLIVPTRGDPSVAWVDWDGASGKLGCNADGAQFALCDEAHRLSYIQNDPNIGLMPDEPFNAFADSTGEFAIITHLTSGAVTLIDSPIGGTAEIADVQLNLFAADPLTGLRGATGVAGRTPGSLGDIVYVGSRSENRIQTLTVGRPVNGTLPYLVPGDWFFLDAIGNTGDGNSEDTRDIAFSPSGNRMYLLNRLPASLQIFDTSLGPTGFPNNQGEGGVAVCRQASQLSILDAGDGERAYVTCFQDGQIYVVDPRGTSAIVDIIEVGRGPYAIAASATRGRIYVSNFLEYTVAVIDVSPTSKTRDRVVLRIGIPTVPGSTQ
jgi:DNA-binding beta-propeller fold protein YncE